MVSFPKTNQDLIDRVRRRETAALRSFLGEYREPLISALHHRLAGRDNAQDLSRMPEHVDEFLNSDLELEGHEEGYFHSYLVDERLRYVVERKQRKIPNRKQGEASERMPEWQQIGVLARRPPQDPVWQDAAVRFRETYLNPLLAFVRRRLSTPQARRDAEDYVEEFLDFQLVELRLLRSADAAKGCFHEFMRRGCWNYVLDQLRRQTARGADDLSLQQYLQLAQETPSADDNLAFDRAWALTLLFDALVVWFAEQEQGESAAWRLFEARALRPFVEGREPTPYQQICQKLTDHTGKPVFETAKKAADALTPIKTQIQDCLRKVLEQRISRWKIGGVENRFVDDPTTVDQWVQEQLVEFRQLLDDEKGRIESGKPRKRECASGERQWSPVDMQTGDLPLLRRYLDQRLGRAAPDLSTSTCGAPEPPVCSLYQIALVLTEEAPVPTEAELAEGMQELMSRPLAPILAEARCQAEQQETATVDLTVSELIHHEMPPTLWLAALKKSIKDDAKRTTGRTWDDNRHAIYYACLAVEIVARGRAADPEFTRLTPERQAAGIRWLAKRTWIDERTRTLAERALACLAQ